MKIENLTFNQAFEYLNNISCLKSLDHSPRHFKVENDIWMLYVDKKNYWDPEATCKVSIMKWDEKSRPQKTFQEFFESAKPETQACFAFHLDMFR